MGDSEEAPSGSIRSPSGEDEERRAQSTSDTEGNSRAAAYDLRLPALPIRLFVGPCNKKRN